MSSIIIGIIERIINVSDKRSSPTSLLPTLSVMFEPAFITSPKSLIAIADNGVHPNTAGDKEAN